MGKTSERLKIAVIAPPWLSMYPGCFYGIENVVHNLTSTLAAQGHHVELFTVSGTKTKVTKIHWYHKDEQYVNIHRPWYEVVSIIASHILYSLNIIHEAGDFDIIHDHNSFLGPAIMANAGSNLPPVLHTLHEPFTDKRLVRRGIPDNRLMFEHFRPMKDLYFNGISDTQLKTAPKELKSRIQGVIYNGVDVNDYTYSDKKKDFFLSVARISPDKGQGVAAKICNELGAKLKIAGTVGAGIRTSAQLTRELANPLSFYANDPEIKYFKNHVQPYLVPGQIEYLGTITGNKKQRLFSQAKAFLFPIDWEEPFGMAVIDALSSGTPVVTFKRGAMPEIIQHGVNGFLANTPREFKQYLNRVGEINPADCRRSVEERFSAKIMADNYVQLYRKIIQAKN